MTEEYNSNEEISEPYDNHTDENTRRLFEEANEKLRVELDAEGYFPTEDVQLLKYRNHFMFFQPPITDSNGFLRKNCICLECFRSNPNDLKFFKGTRVGFYNHLNNRHVAAFREVQNGRESINRSLNKSVSPKLQSRRRSGRKRKKSTTSVASISPVVEEIVPQPKVRSRRAVLIEPSIVDAFAIGATVSIPIKKSEDRLEELFCAGPIQPILEDNKYHSHERSNLLLLKLCLRLDFDFMNTILHHKAFHDFIKSIIAKEEHSALNYSIPSASKLRNLLNKVSSYLIRVLHKRIKENRIYEDTKRSFVSLVLSLRRLEGSRLSVFGVSIGFINRNTWEVEVWNLLEASFSSSRKLDIVSTILNLLKLLEIEYSDIAHIYCDLELSTGQELSEVYLSQSPSFLGLLSTLKSHFNCSRLLETSISAMLGDILDLRGYGIAPLNVLPNFLSWLDEIHTYLPEEVKHVPLESISSVTFSLRLPELLELVLNHKTQICITAMRENSTYNLADNDNWTIVEELMSILKPFTFVLCRGTKSKFNKSFIVPWLLFCEKYFEQKTFRLVFKVDGVAIEQHRVIEHDAVQIIQSGIQKKVQGYIRQVVMGSEGDHLLLFTALDPRTKDFLSSNLCTQTIKDKGEKLISRIMLTHCDKDVKSIDEIEVFMNTPYKPTEALFEYSLLFQRLDSSEPSPFKWFVKNSKSFPNIFAVAVLFLPFSFVTLSEDELLLSQITQVKKQREEIFKHSFLRTNWDYLETSYKSVGCKSVLSAIEFTKTFDFSLVGSSQKALDVICSKSLLNFL